MQKRNIPYLGPVKLNFFGRHPLHSPAEIVGYTNRVGIGLEVLHGDGDGEVGGEEQAEARKRHDLGYPSLLDIMIERGSGRTVMRETWWANHVLLVKRRSSFQDVL